MTTATRHRRPKMTAEEARTFDGISPKQYVAVKAALEARGCDGCEPYQDVFTLPRWNAQGFRVNKGEKAVKVTVWVPCEPAAAEVERALDEDDDAPAVRMRPKTANLFCRCQVREVDAQREAA